MDLLVAILRSNIRVRCAAARSRASEGRH